MRHRAPMYDRTPMQQDRRISLEYARNIYNALDQDRRLSVFEAVGPCAPNRLELALGYLRDPVHLAMLNIKVVNGKPVAQF